MSKKVIIIAGPNGAGKTTFARTFVPAEPQCPHADATPTLLDWSENR